ncbi:MAG TPA: hypothetical protein VLJ15_06940 [Gammaproteobacteria bacterium]|nr:hypothetical protein [Gammaproteobacteria bacterium]
MSAMEPLCRLASIDPTKFTREEKFIIEMELFTRICEVLGEEFKTGYQNYFRLLKCDAEMENAVMEANFLRCLINDILSTEEYTLSGIARYTQTPEDVVYELATGLNTNPSAIFLRKIIELHRFVRRELYSMIIEKIMTDYFKNK